MHDKINEFVHAAVYPERSQIGNANQTHEVLSPAIAEKRLSRRAQIVLNHRAMWKEFKEFAVKGNALDLAVGVIIGAAFGGVISSLVKDIIMPPLGLLTGGLDFSNQFFVLKPAPGGATFATPADAAKAGAVTWNYGNFITLLINFLIVALAIFLVVKVINRMKRPATAEKVSKECPACTMTIPIKARRCPECTTELDGAQIGRA